MTAAIDPAGSRRQADFEVWVRRGCALVVAGVAAYASYEHQREFALDGGSDAVTAALWPLSVDGLLVLATVGLLKPGQQRDRRTRIVVWATFLAGIAVSLAANIAAAPTLSWQPVLVAGWPPVALLLAVELLAHRSDRVVTETAPTRGETGLAAPMDDRDTDIGSERGTVVAVAEVSPSTDRPGGSSAQEIMWAHVQREQARGRTPSGAELDRVAGTNNYGRTVLRQWREQGRIPAAGQDRPNGHCLLPGQDGAQ